MIRKVAAAAAVVVMLAAGCQSAKKNTAEVGTASETPSAVTTSVEPTTATPEVTYVPTAGAGGAYLPDRATTPGATNPDVTQASIASTICRSGFTRSIRPAVDFTNNLKAEQLAAGYAIRGNTDPTAYEEDHLIPFELGGAPDDPKNLWPEPWEKASNHPAGFAAAGQGAQTKDRIEDSLRSRVCDGRVTLAAAQQMISSDWRAAFDRYIGVVVVRTSATATAVATTTPTPTTTTAKPVAALTCTASMSDPTPAQYSTTTVVVHTSPGAHATATAHYKTTDTTNSATAGGNGVANIPFRIARATKGYRVEVDVTVSLSGRSASCSTSFTPQ